MNETIRFPAEFEPHHGTLLIWPERPGSWGKDPRAAEKAFLDIIEELLRSEKVYLLVNPSSIVSVMEKILGRLQMDTPPANFQMIGMETDDSWARDTGPTFVYRGVKRLGVKWSFNAWGGEVDGLYASWEKDDKVAVGFTTFLGDPMLDARPFVLEGGSIHTDGEGTLLVTESCLLSAGRNPQLSKEQIEDKLKEYLGVEKILWLPRGIYQDETNEHVDNMCAFVRPGEVVLAWTDKKEDPQYELSRLDYEYLQNVTDARGRKLIIHKLWVPDHPVCVSQEDLENFVFEPGEDEREAGERLAASYVNFYFANGAVLLPQFGGENAESDARAVQILSELCPDRRIVPIYARHILFGGGNIHCITQQIPL